MSRMLDKLQQWGADTFHFLRGLGKSTGLFFRVITSGLPFRLLIPAFIKQIYMIGVLSLPIILVSGLFIGMVLSLQGFQVLVDFGAEVSLGPMVALSLLRELGPVVTALLFAGRAGSALTAEIGLMKATEQLSSLEMMAVDPLKRIILPRMWAGVFSMPLLACIFCLVGIIGGKFVGVDWLGLDSGSYWSIMQANVEWGQDIGGMLIKSLFFAVVVTWLAVYRGYDALPTSEGISRATTQTVVQASLAVLGLDFILTALMFG